MPRYIFGQWTACLLECFSFLIYTKSIQIPSIDKIYKNKINLQIQNETKNVTFKKGQTTQNVDVKSMIAIVLFFFLGK